MVNALVRFPDIQSPIGRKGECTLSPGSDKYAISSLYIQAPFTNEVKHAEIKTEPHPMAKYVGHYGEMSTVQAAFNFFCKLVDEVVYWNTMRSPGLTMRLAACDIKATSWKPDRMSFNLPG